MKALPIWLTVTVLLLTGDSFAFDPPRGLKFGLGHDDVVAALAMEDCKIKAPNTKNVRKALREYSEFGLPDGYTRAAVEGLALLDQKAEPLYLVYDALGGLVSFQYIFKWVSVKEDTEHYRKAWVFHADLKKSLEKKYGAPAEDEATADNRAEDMPSGIKYLTQWVDKDGSVISLCITRQTHNVVIAEADCYYVFLFYSAPGFDNGAIQREGGDDDF